MLTIYDHETELHNHSLSTYIVETVLLLVMGLGVLIYNIQNSLANFEYVLATVDIIFIIIVPIMTMKSISEERKQHTDLLLYSLPLSMTDIVCGKYLAILSRLLYPIIIVCAYPLIFKRFGDVYLPTAYGSILAFFLLGGCFIAVGLFISSLTENQGLAAGITAAVIALDYFIVSLSEYVSSTVAGTIIVLEIALVLLCLVLRWMTKNTSLALIFGLLVEIAMAVVFMINRSLYEGLVPDIMNKISLYERFYAFVNGVFDVTAIVYYISVIALFLFFTVQSMEKRRYS